MNDERENRRSWINATLPPLKDFLDLLVEENSLLKDALDQIAYALSHFQYRDELLDLLAKIEPLQPANFHAAQLSAQVGNPALHRQKILCRSLPFQSTGQAFKVEYSISQINMWPTAESGAHVFTIPKGRWMLEGSDYADLILKGFDQEGLPEKITLGGASDSQDSKGTQDSSHL